MTRIKEPDGVRGIAVLLAIPHPYSSWAKITGAQYY
jgi:hypothetical protein